MLPESPRERGVAGRLRRGPDVRACVLACCVTWVQYVHGTMRFAAGEGGVRYHWGDALCVLRAECVPPRSAMALGGDTQMYVCSSRYV